MRLKNPCASVSGMSEAVEAKPSRRFVAQTANFTSKVMDLVRSVEVAEFDRIAYPDHVRRAQIEADALEAKWNPPPSPPEWKASGHFVDGPGGLGMRCVDGFNQPHKELAARAAELFTRHGFTDSEQHKARAAATGHDRTVDHFWPKDTHAVTDGEWDAICSRLAKLDRIEAALVAWGRARAHRATLGNLPSKDVHWLDWQNANQAEQAALLDLYEIAAGIHAPLGGEL